MLRDELLAPTTIEVPPRTRFSRFIPIFGRYKPTEIRGGHGHYGAGNWERGTGNGELGTGNGERGTLFFPQLP